MTDGIPITVHSAGAVRGGRAEKERGRDWVSEVERGRQVCIHLQLGNIKVSWIEMCL